MYNTNSHLFRNLIPFLFLALASPLLHAQNGIVSGVVLDSKTGEPLPFANVFLNNTTIGKATDLEGKFKLEGLPVGVTEIVASFVGYEPQYKRVVLRDNKEMVVELKLTPLDKELEGVELVSKRDKKWERQLRRFERAFLGDDHLAKEAKIVNPWVLDFEDGKEAGDIPYFAAKANEPLEIENMALGYKINYFLRDFKQTRRGMYFVGLVQYTEMSTLDAALAEKWHANRQGVYLGSTRHFFKSMINNDLKSQGFVVYEELVGFQSHPKTNRLAQEIGNTVEPFVTDKMAAPGDRIGEYKLFAKRKLEIHYVAGKAPNSYYLDAFYPLSWISFNGGSIDVSAKGVALDPYDLVVSGHMSKVRLAHMLPYNFNPDESINNYDPSLLASTTSKWNNLLEKPYLHTDKPYYYPGETIWLKGYMIYENPLMVDTLSRVLYVDLINEAKVVVQSHSFPIESGETRGQLSLPPTAPAGNYTVRAYTHWMRNFDPKDFFYKPIPVLNIYEKALSDDLPVESTSATSAIYSPIQLAVVPEKDAFQQREKVSFSVELTDANGRPLASDISVAVVDTSQVAYVAEEKDIVDAYEWAQTTKDVTLEKPEYQIEYGIGFKGIFRNRKDEPEAVSLMVVQGNYDDYGTIATDSSGRFWASGLQFIDSAEVAFGAFDKKGRPYGSVQLAERIPPALPDKLPAYTLNIVEKNEPQRSFSLDGKEGYTLLDEVTVKGDKVERMEEKNYGYGVPDRSISGEKLEKAHGNNALLAMQGMGSVRIHYRTDPNTGLSVPFIKLSTAIPATPMAISSPMATEEIQRSVEDPLLIIDGSRVYTENVAQFLSEINANELKKIDIYTYNAPIFGMAGQAGVIMIETKKGERVKEDPSKKFFNKDGFSVFSLKGYTAAADFTAPDYSVPKESHENPDYRSTLYWNPSIETDQESGKASFAFYSADLSTTYKVVIEGVTADQTPFREVRYVKVGR